MRITITILVTAALTIGACFLVALFWTALLDPPVSMIASFVTGLPLGIGAMLFGSWMYDSIRD